MHLTKLMVMIAAWSKLLPKYKDETVDANFKDLTGKIKFCTKDLFCSEVPKYYNEPSIHIDIYYDAFILEPTAPVYKKLILHRSLTLLQRLNRGTLQGTFSASYCTVIRLFIIYTIFVQFTWRQRSRNKVRFPHLMKAVQESRQTSFIMISLKF